MARTWVQRAGIAVVLASATAAAVVALLTMDPTGANAPRTGSRYVEEAQKAAPVDPSLLRWERALTIPVGMASPRALGVVSGGRVVVVGDRVELRGPGGDLLRQSPPAASPYRAVAIDAAGRAFALAQQAVDQLDLDDAELRVVAHLDLAAPGRNLTGIAATAHGLYVADAPACKVWRLPLTGDGGLDATGAATQYAKGFFVPSTMELATAADGELITVDPGRHEVQRRDVYGDVVARFGKEGGGIADFHGCCNPTAVAAFADGRVATAEKGLGATRVKVYTAAGELQSVVAENASFQVPPDGPPLLLDVAVDRQGRVLVLDPQQRHVLVFASKEQGR